MSKAPFYSPNLSRFRDRAESGKYNKFQQEVFYDLIELFNIANEQEDKIANLERFFEVASHYSQEHIDIMKRELLALKEDLYAVQNPGKTYIKTLFPSDAREDRLSDKSERAFIDVQHDVITLPYSTFSSSKLYLYDKLNDEYILPNTIKYTIEPAADNVTIKENDFLNALTPENHKLWHREYRYFSGLKEYVEATITIELPDNIISNRDVNTIYIHPFPLNTIDIVNLEYQLDGGWNKVPGFHPVNEADNTKFCFSPMEISKIRVTLRQRHFIEKGGHQVFHIGLKAIDVLHNDYQTGVARFELPVSFNPAFTNKQIVDIVPHYQNEEVLSVHQKETKLLTFKVFELDENGKERYISDTFPIQIKSNNILLKGVLSFDRNTRTTPALTSVEVFYKGDS